MDVLSQLQSHPLFAGLTPEALAEVVRAGTPVAYDGGDVCIRQGDAGELFGVLISGRLEAVRGYGKGEREHLGYIEPGECFGEMSMLTGTASGADVVALMKSEAVVFLQEAISPIIALNRDAVQFLTRLITRRLTAAQEKRAAPRATAVRYSLGASSPLRILAVSCRKEDVRYSYFDTSSEKPQAQGMVLGLGNGRQTLHIHQGPRGKTERRVDLPTHEAALASILAALTSKDGGVIDSVSQLSAIGHRVVHGGIRFAAPTVLDEDAKQAIRRLATLAPLDNEYNLKGIEACERLAAGVPQVAVFDTSFHLKMPAAAHHYALPKDLSGEGELRRYGFHGISHEGTARAAAAFLAAPFESLKMITCHLGNGASLTAIDHGRSVDNTMGFTPLEGLVMATRSGDVDPGLVLYLIQERGISPDELRRRLFTESGLLGLSGVSDNLLAITEEADEGHPRALLAVQVFCQRARKYLGAYLALLGGADVIVFTGGIGQNSPGIRARICQGLDWMGVLLDEQRNRGACVQPGEVVEISQVQSRSRVLVAASDEERTIARQTVRALAQARVTDVIRRKEPRAIPIGVSAHHVHLTQEHVQTLFGAGHTLTWHSDLTQPGQYACQEQVDLIGPKGRIERVRVLGPVRPESQVEISRTEEFKLGIDAPVRMSGDLKGTPGITLEGPQGKVVLDQGVICAMRHIHMAPQDAMEFAVRDHDVVRIRVRGERSLTFGDVVVRVDPTFRLDMHVDTDEANAAELGHGAFGYLDSIEQRVSA